MLSRVVGSGDADGDAVAPLSASPGHGNPVAGLGISDNAQSSTDPGL